MTSTATTVTAPSRHRTSSWTHMPGLDGVRAIAVAAVVIFHLDESWLPGGFLGVDVFFTLSGFLITSLLLAELRSTDRVSFRRFYLRRARRLLPALYLVLLVSSILAITLAQDAAERLRQDVVAAFFYVTNWWYVLQDTSYWTAAERPPLLQHLWSLAVEEQFYFVWPLLVLLLWRLGRTRAIGIGAAVGALVSTVLMAWFATTRGMPVPNDPSRVYFGSDTHAMTLLVGAVLATVWSPARLGELLTVRGRRVMTIIGTVALVLLVAVFWFVGSDSSRLYRGGFLVVGVLTAAVVAAAAVSASAFARALAVAPMRWVGERSYGIYLWHWPIFMVLRPGVDIASDGLWVQGARIALTLVVAELSYRFVERPIRDGALGRAWTRWRESGRSTVVGRAVVAGVVALAVVGSLGFGLVRTQSQTLATALDGVEGVGDEDLTPTPTASPSVTPTASGTGTASPTAGPTSTAPPVHVPPTLVAGQDAYGLSVTGVGDSVMLAARKAVLSTLPHSLVDAKVGRQADDVFDRIRERKAAGKLGDVVIIHTGTNGVVSTTRLVALLRLLQDRSRVVLVTPHAQRSWTAQANRAIWNAAKQFPGGNVRVADWNTFSAGHTDWFYADGIHTKSAGSAQYAALLRRTLSR